MHARSSFRNVHITLIPFVHKVSETLSGLAHGLLYNMSVTS